MLIRKKLVGLTGVARLLSMILGTAVASTLATSAGAEIWSPVYQNDFSSDPGWTTNVPYQMYWDSAGKRYHAELHQGDDQIAKVYLPYSLPNTNFKLDYDIIITQNDDVQVAMSFGLSDHDHFVRFPGTYEPTSLWTNWDFPGAAVGYFNNSSHFGMLPGPYDFHCSMNTLYHNSIVYDKDAQSLEWLVTSGGLPVGHFTTSGVGTFMGFDRLLIQNGNYGGGVFEAYLDNVAVSVSSQGVPEPSTLVLWSGLGAMGSVLAWRRQRH